MEEEERKATKFYVRVRKRQKFDVTKTVGRQFILSKKRKLPLAFALSSLTHLLSHPSPRPPIASRPTSHVPVPSVVTMQPVPKNHSHDDSNK